MRNILCLKCGTGYSEDYVIKLYNMVRRHSSYAYNFYCITDKPFFHENIKIIPLPDHNLKGWWNKPFIFSDIGITGTNLFLDLDIVICNDMEPLWVYEEKEVVFYRGVGRPSINSSVIRFEANSLLHLWNKFSKNKDLLVSTLKGDQDFLRLEILEPLFYPASWLKSYKVELRGKEYLIKGVTAIANRLYPGTPKINDDLIIAVVYGHPKNHNITDQWLVENWQ